MGCGTSKTLAKSASIREEFLTPLRKATRGYKEILVSKNGTDHQFITLLCTSNTLSKQLKEHESPKQSSLSMTPEVEEPEDCEKNIETINTWELLAGLEDEEEVEEQGETDSLKSLNLQDDGKEKKQGGEREKGLRRKLMASELAALKVPAFEFSRTGSLRDWLMHGGKVMANGSNVTPKFGRFEHDGASGSGEMWEENVIDAELVAQLEQAMEDMTVEEEEILSQIVEKLEGNVWT